MSREKRYISEARLPDAAKAMLKMIRRNMKRKRMLPKLPKEKGETSEKESR